MSILFRRFLAPALALAVLLPSTLWAGSLAGTTTNAAGTGVSGLEVRLWANTSKGYAIAETTLSGASGAYTFASVLAGDYKLDARMPAGFSGSYGDTWYDVAPPTSSGLIGADADIITIGASDTLTGYDISLPTSGAIEGFVLNSSAARQALVNIRVESSTEHRYHHNDLSKSEVAHRGLFSMHGLVANDYRVLAYDRDGDHELLVANGPYTVTTGVNTIGNVSLSPMGADASEPNNDPSSASSVATLPFASTGAIVAPRGDVDWYCTTVAEGDRLLASVNTTVSIDGTDRAHPWLDPVLGFFSASGATFVSANDDATPGAGYDSLVDTGLLSADTYCFVVTTFGDSDWAGTGQQSAGRYGFELEMGNRAPVITVTTNGGAVTEAPGITTTDEGAPQQFELQYSDVDGDMLMPDVTVVDGSGNPVMGTFTNNGTDGVFVWTPSQTAAVDGPYELVFSVTDGEFLREVRVIVTANSINVPPTVPVLDSPIANARVTVDEVPLVVQNSSDADNDALLYDYQVEVGTPDGTPELTGSAFEDISGLTAWTTTALAENSRAIWRARASDGMGPGGFSAWSEWEAFFVDTQNEPPVAPTILKPEFDESVMVTIPRISATIPADPEDDDLVLRFEIATDVNFENVSASSPDVDASAATGSVEWTTDPPLADGARYYVRAQAEDVLGAIGPWSATSEFRIPSLELPDVPGWTGEYAEYCATGGFTVEDAPSSIVVANVDGSGDTVEFQFQILEVESDSPIYDITVPQSDDTTTEIPIDSSVLNENGQYVFRMRTVRGDEMRDWLGCNVSVNAGDDPVTTLEIISPEKGLVFRNPADVMIVVRNPYDPDPVEQMEMRYCVSETGGEWEDCPENVQEWPAQTWRGAGESQFSVDVAAGETRFIKVCAVRVGVESCAMSDDTWFKVAGGTTGSGEEGCGCASTDGSNATPLGFLLVALFWSRRRRRRS